MGFIKDIRSGFIYGLLIVLFSSCGIQKSVLDKQYDTRAISQKLGVKVTNKDYVPFFIEAASWVGTPYRAGGSTKRGTDCSGFIYSFYNQFFKMKITRNSESLYYDSCNKIRKSKLEPGDLVFFRTGRGRKITHVGLYLKDGKFIHASTSKGVMVNSLNEDYYRKTWKGAGRVRL